MGFIYTDAQAGYSLLIQPGGAGPKGLNSAGVQPADGDYLYCSCLPPPVVLRLTSPSRNWASKGLFVILKSFYIVNKKK